jgi:hypothetical protein
MDPNQIYSDEFYKLQVGNSYASAIKFARTIANHLSINSLLDVGCGRGAWIRAFCEVFSIDNLTDSVLGIDGPWNSGKELMADFRYLSCNLDCCSKISLNRSFDLAISLAVAEHLSITSGEHLVNLLCRHSDVVIFSAATVSQGGIGHINEVYPSAWAKVFQANGFSVYDLFRPLLIGDVNICPWYTQNAFLYVKDTSPFAHELSLSSISPLQNLKFMDMYHYELFARRSSLRGVLIYILHVLAPDFFVQLVHSLYKKFIMASKHFQ